MSIFTIGYISGIIGCMLSDYVEAKIVNRDYEKEMYSSQTTTHYLGGIRPPRYQVIFYALIGLIAFAMGIHSMYNYIRGNYGEFK